MAQSGREIIANAPRLERYMDANGLDAVAVRTGANFTYLAGIALPGTLARHLDISQHGPRLHVGVAPQGRAGRGARFFR